MTNKPLQGKLIAVIGFGNVGKATARYLKEMGAEVWIDDTDPKKRWEAEKKYPIFRLHEISSDHFFDVIIPCAASDVIDGLNYDWFDAPLIIEGGNCQIAEGIKPKLRKKGIVVFDDYIASAGGVIASDCELKGLTTKQAFEVIKKEMKCKH